MTVRLSEWAARLGFVAAGLGVTTVPAVMVSALPRGVVALTVDDPELRGRSMILAHVGAPSSQVAAVHAAVVQRARVIAGTTTSADAPPGLS